MEICAVVKYPPIQGGVSARCYWIVRALAMMGHHVHVVTNAAEVEEDYRLWIPPGDQTLSSSGFPNGGTVDVVSTGHDPRRMAHIPQGTAFVTALSALATEQIRRHGCEVVFAYYFEPYGMAAHLASTWTGVPLIVQHAGSDRGRLMSHPDLALAYREMLRHAELVVSNNPSLVGLGIGADKLVQLPIGFLPDGLFTPQGPALDVDALLSAAQAHPFVRTVTPLPVGVPVFGVLGKVGEVKGSYDLVRALARMAEDGHEFVLLAMVAGTDRGNFLAAIDDAGLGHRTWTLPLLPHSRVGEFIRACTAVCVLERDFPIAAHSPSVPREVMASGVCAVLSGEMAAKQPWPIRHGVDALVVDDPTDVAQLADVLTSVLDGRVDAEAVGTVGAELTKSRGLTELGLAYEAVLARAGSRRRGPSSSDGIAAFLARHAPATSRLRAQEIAAADSVAPEATPSAAYELIDTWWQQCGEDSQEREIIGYERDLVWLAVDLESAAGIPVFPASSLFMTEPGDALVLVRTNWMRLARHPSDVEALTHGVGGPVDGGGSLAWYLFHKRGDLSPCVYRIGEATAALIDLCDGSLTPEQVTRQLVQAHIGDRDQVGQAIRRLVRDQVLAVRPASNVDQVFRATLPEPPAENEVGFSSP